MDLIEELETATIKGSSNRSKIDQIIDGSLKPAEGHAGLDESERNELHDLVVNPKFGTAAIHQVLSKRGYDLGESSVRRYRQKHSR